MEVIFVLLTLILFNLKFKSDSIYDIGFTISIIEGRIVKHSFYTYQYSEEQEQVFWIAFNLELAMFETGELNKNRMEKLINILRN
jgi:hypothetical protein